MSHGPCHSQKESRRVQRKCRLVKSGYRRAERPGFIDFKDSELWWYGTRLEQPSNTEPLHSRKRSPWFVVLHYCQWEKNPSTYQKSRPYKACVT